jgi:hypothetical protein
VKVVMNVGFPNGIPSRKLSATQDDCYHVSVFVRIQKEPVRNTSQRGSFLLFLSAKKVYEQGKVTKTRILNYN